MNNLEQKLSAIFASSWNDIAPIYTSWPLEVVFGDLRELAENEMNSALAVARTWSAAFAIDCTGEDGSGVLVCLFKSEDNKEFNSLIKHSEDGKPSPATRLFLKEVFKRASSTFEEEETAQIHFGEAEFFDLTNGNERLTQMVGDTAWLGTYALNIKETESQMLLVYAPNGSIEGVNKIVSNEIISSFDSQDESEDEPTEQLLQSSQSFQTQFPVEDKRVKHLERLLDVELDVVVRFGVTNLPLRDVVHLGVGTMLELNRMVDAPVEILVNGRLLASGDVVVIDGYYGVRITSIGTQNERALSLL